MKKVTFIFVCLYFAILSQARIITVDDDGSADFNNIQAAINDANNGDTIIVSDGIYNGDGNRDIDFNGKTITLKSEGGPENCIIDCNGTEELHRGFYFHSGEGADSVLDGFTITNGCAYKGGAIYCRYSSSPTIINCIIRGNISPYEYVPDPFLPMVILQDGGGIYCSESNPIIKNCHFIENIATAGGGAICSWHGNALVDSCVIKSNWAGISGGAIELFGDNMSIHNCVITGNSAGDVYYYSGGVGGAICCSGFYSSTPTISNCTISGNRTVRYGGGILCGDQSDVTVSNSVVWGNNALEGHEVGLIYGAFGPSSLTISYSDIQGGAAGVFIGSVCTLNWKAGNIDVDPCFAEPGYWDPNGTPEDANDDFWVGGNYHLKSQASRWNPDSKNWVQDEVTSPCIDAGDPHSPIGLEPFPNGGIINMGAYGGTAEASKSYFGEPVCETIVAGDINGDCKVNFKDFAIMAFHWLEER